MYGSSGPIRVPLSLTVYTLLVEGDYYNVIDDGTDFTKILGNGLPIWALSVLQQVGVILWFVQPCHV